MKLTVTFICQSCGLLTPGLAELPDDVDVRRRLELEHVCHHCGEQMTRTARISEYLCECEEPKP